MTALAVIGATPSAVGLADELERIEATRRDVRQSLEAAERDMLDRATTDRDGFVEAKARREAAQLTLEQLDWAEKAEHQRRVRVEQDARMAKLGEQQVAARDAHARGAALANKAELQLHELCETLRGLRECQAAVDKGVHFEQFAVNAGEIPRATVRPRLTIDPDAAVLALRAAKEYLRLAQVAEAVGEMRAVQSKL